MNIVLIIAVIMFSTVVAAFIVFFVHSPHFVHVVHLMAKIDGRKIGYKDGEFTHASKGIYVPGFLRNYVLNHWTPSFPWLVDNVILMDEKIMFGNYRKETMAGPRNRQRDTVILTLAQWVKANKVDASFVPYKLAQGVGFVEGDSEDIVNQKWQHLFMKAPQEVVTIRNAMEAGVSLSFFKSVNQKRYEELDGKVDLETVVDFTITVDEFKELKQLPLDLAVTLS